MLFDKIGDGLLKRAETAVNSPFNLSLGQERKEAFYLIDP